ncbi:hypothetical protein FRC07_005258 [Ceratobasidium sp. 392]|nr:hypothetical protein FRC07_005258 [Ceratobasidium sp. 392]
MNEPPPLSPQSKPSASTARFPTIPDRDRERKSVPFGHGLRDWRVPRPAPRNERKRDKDNPKISDPDKMVILPQDAVDVTTTVAHRQTDAVDCGPVAQATAAVPSQNAHLGASKHFLDLVYVHSRPVPIFHVLPSVHPAQRLVFVALIWPCVRFGYPLYQPPLPTPPNGVKLGIVDATEEPWRRRKNTKTNRDKPLPVPGADATADWTKRYGDYDNTETETDASPLPLRRTPTTSTSTVASGKFPAIGRTSSSSASSTPRGNLAPPSRLSTPAGTPLRSNKGIEAEERADVTSPLVPSARARQQSGLSVRSAMSGETRSPGMWNISNTSSSTDLMETDGAIDAIIRDYVPRTGEEKSKRSVKPSIDESIRMHVPAVVAANQVVSKRSASRNGSLSVPSTPITATAPSIAGSSLLGTGVSTPQSSAPGHSRAPYDNTEAEVQRLSINSIADEAQRALQALQDQEATALAKRRTSVGEASSMGANIPNRLHHARSLPKAQRALSTVIHIVTTVPAFSALG